MPFFFLRPDEILIYIFLKGTANVIYVGKLNRVILANMKETSEKNSDTISKKSPAISG